MNLKLWANWVRADPTERLVFWVRSFDKRSQTVWYRVDLEASEGNGACDCWHFRKTLASQVESYGRYGVWLRCKHIIRARSYFCDVMLAQIAKHLKAQRKVEHEPHQTPTARVQRQSSPPSTIRP